MERPNYYRSGAYQELGAAGHRHVGVRRNDAPAVPDVKGASLDVSAAGVVVRWFGQRQRRRHRS